MEHVLVPIDGSDNAERALRFGAELARRYDATIEVVHITDVETESTSRLLEDAEAVLEDEGVAAEPRVQYDLRLTFKASDRIGEGILDLVAEAGYDHVVMGHHGSGAVERLLLGSATESVIRANEVPVSVIP